MKELTMFLGMALLGFSTMKERERLASLAPNNSISENPNKKNSLDARLHFLET